MKRDCASVTPEVKARIADGLHNVFETFILYFRQELANRGDAGSIPILMSVNEMREWGQNSLKALAARTLQKQLDGLARTRIQTQGQHRPAMHGKHIRRAKRVPNVPREFIERGDLRTDVRAMLDGGVRVLVHGLGGAGKTALGRAGDRGLAGDGARGGALRAGGDGRRGRSDGRAGGPDWRGQGGERGATRRGAGGRAGDAIEARGITLVWLDDVWNARTLNAIAEGCRTTWRCWRRRGIGILWTCGGCFRWER